MEGKAPAEIYSRGSVNNIVTSLGIKIYSETDGQINTTCPYHNDSRPSFSINTESGLFHCFNPNCNKSGPLINLVMTYGNMNIAEALRFMAKGAPKQSDTIVDQLESLLKDEEEFEPYDQAVINALKNNLAQEAIDYMGKRGINEDTLRRFGAGYSSKMGMVALPLYSHNNIPVGIVGRSVTGKMFKYSKNAPIGKILFNLNNARRESSTVILVEASFDVLKIDQAGYPNSVAVLGGSLSDYKFNLLNKYFDRIIIMTDADEAGRAIGKSVVRKFNREILWACMSSTTVYPDGCKDPGDMTEAQIRQAVENALPDYEYQMYFE